MRLKVLSIRSTTENNDAIDNCIKNTIIATCISIKEVETPIKENGSQIVNL